MTKRWASREEYEAWKRGEDQRALGIAPVVVGTPAIEEAPPLRPDGVPAGPGPAPAGSAAATREALSRVKVPWPVTFIAALGGVLGLANIVLDHGGDATRPDAPPAVGADPADPAAEKPADLGPDRAAELANALPRHNVAVARRQCEGAFVDFETAEEGGLVLGNFRLCLADQIPIERVGERFYEVFVWPTYRLTVAPKDKTVEVGWDEWVQGRLTWRRHETMRFAAGQYELFVTEQRTPLRAVAQEDGWLVGEMRARVRIGRTKMQLPYDRLLRAALESPGSATRRGVDGVLGSAGHATTTRSDDVDVQVDLTDIVLDVIIVVSVHEETGHVKLEAHSEADLDSHGQRHRWSGLARFDVD